MRILIGLSGGIDSTVAAFLLKEAGHEVIGVTMSIWRQGNPFSGEIKEGACFGPNEVEDIAEAKRIAALLEIEHHVLDCAREYEAIVLQDFKNEYIAGRTPNPCIWCNSLIKFGALPTIARQAGLKFDKFATGHYAKVSFENQRWQLRQAQDNHKDQTYFLYRLSQEQLSQLILPLGDFTKEEVRHIALERGFSHPDKGESQDFYSGSYSDLVQTEAMPGEIVDSQGNLLGHHQGIWNYTIGQRRGLGISSTQPLYVLALDAKHNQVVVGYEEETFGKELRARQLSWLSIEPPTGQLAVQAKIRSTGRAQQAVLTVIAPDEVSLCFQQPVKAITPGQSVVFYQEDLVLGGGVIVSN